MSLTLQEAELRWRQVLFEGEEDPPGRFGTYRRLIRKNLLKVLKNLNPVAAEILSESDWNLLLKDFLAGPGAKSHILRELPGEVAQFLRTGDHPLVKKYPYLGELLEYEYLEIQVRYAPEDPQEYPGKKIFLTRAHAMGEYRWPVHYIGQKFADPKKLPTGQYHLLLWRHPKTLEVRFMEINPLVASLVAQLEGGGREEYELLEAVARDHQMELNPEFFQEGRALLRELREKGVLRRFSGS